MIKLTQLMNESEEKRPLSLEVKKHFLEIVSTYNKYQESMDRKSDITQVAETLGGITEAARTLAIHEGDDWFDKHTIKRNMSELDKLGKQFDKVALEAKALDQRMGGLYEDMGHILSRYYKIGEISEEQMKERLGMNESKEDCGCGCNGTTPGGCGDKSVNESLEFLVNTYKDGKSYIGYYDSRNRFDKTKFITTPYGNTKDAIKVAKSLAKKNKGKYVDDFKINQNHPDNYAKKGSIKESVNEGTDIYSNNRIQITKFSGGKDGKLIQINAPKIQGSGDHIIMKIDDFKKMLKKSSNLLKQVQESLNEEPVAVSMRNDDGSITTTIKEVNELNEQETALYEFGQKVETLMEENCPTDASKWSSYKSQAKKKFDVYPSAYANGWAAKKYKAAGGGWKKC